MNRSIGNDNLSLNSQQISVLSRFAKKISIGSQISFLFQHIDINFTIMIPNIPVAHINV